MKAKWLNRYNEETKQTEHFYPITHADAVVDLDTKIQENVESVTDSLSSHIENTDVHFTAVERTKLAGIATGAEVNQNAFSNIKVGTTTVAADTKTDTIEFVGSNVTITPDATNDKVTFAVADGSTSAKGVVQLTNSTSSTSTTTAATPSSVKSAYDLANTAKTNAATAQTRADSAYSLAESKVDSLSDLGITATATELNYVNGVTSNIQDQLNGKQATITGGATTITGSNLTTNRALISNGSGKVTVSAVTSTELGYLDGVTSAIQTQLNGKAASSHNQAAGTITAGTLAGKVVANASAVATVTTKQVRNIFAGTTEATAGSAFSGLSDGDIYYQYEQR